jgi:uncharacterized protein (DUF1778 family)
MARHNLSPKESTPARNERLEARVSRDQKALFRKAADLQGRTLTDFVIASVHDAAVRTINDARTIRLNEVDSRQFAEALLNPRKPTARLKAAARRYLRTVGE